MPAGLGRSIGVVDLSTSGTTTTPTSGGGYEGRAGSVGFHFSAQQQTGTKRTRNGGVSEANVVEESAAW